MISEGKGSNISFQGFPETSKIKFQHVFVEPSEQYISSIGNEYITNFLLNNSLSKGFAIVSDKRVYFKGKCYYQNDNGKLKKRFTEQIVDLKDVTGTGYKRVNPTWILILSIFFAIVPLVIGAIILKSDSNSNLASSIFGLLVIFWIIAPGTTLIVYFIKKINIFEISFSGGRIAFNSELYDKSEIDDFQRNLRRAKDNTIAIGEVQKANVCVDKIGKADELIKFSELLKQGAITQEEYDQLKRGVLADIK